MNILLRWWYDYFKPYKKRSKHIKIYKDGGYAVMNWYILSDEFCISELESEMRELGLEG